MALIAHLKTALSFTPKVSPYALLVVAKGMMLINRKYYYSMNKVIIDKGNIPSTEEEDDLDDMPPLVLIEYD